MPKTGSRTFYPEDWIAGKRELSSVSNKSLRELHEGKTTAVVEDTAPSAPSSAEPVQCGPSDVLARIKRGTERMGELHVVGEVFDKKLIKGGHWTFDLKDKRGSLPCVVWFNDTRRLKLEMKDLNDGMRIVAVGSPTLTQWAKVQLVVKRVELVDNEGALKLAFEKLKEKLAAEGLFAPERKRALPLLPRTVGVVTSSTGAALRDVITVLYARVPRLRVLVYPTKVQGKEAPAEIADALKRLDKSALCDVILLVRGGGSLEDLWAFNSEPVARAIVNCRVPVVSGVGHETDTTIADLVADKRAATPSNAAELAVPVLSDLERRIASAQTRLAMSLRNALNDARVRLDSKRKRIVDPRHVVERRRRSVADLEKRAERALLRRRDAERARIARLDERLRARAPGRVVAEQRARVIELEKRLARALQKRRDEVTARRKRVDALAARLEPAIAKQRARLGGQFDVLVARLEAISPLTVLARGYAIARRVADGHVVREPSDAPPGTKLVVRVDGGDIRATVDDE